MKKAFLFPGQGAQIIGMGKDIYEKYEEARKIYKEATRISGIDICKICFEGPEEELLKTENTQIAILTTSLAMLEVLKQNNINAEYVVGLSLGEYTGLIYSGILSFEDGIKLIKKRGFYMGNLLPEGKYAMGAVLNFDNEIIEKTCEEIKKEGYFVVPANYNCSSQTVISGEEKAIDMAIERLKEQGAKRIIKLNTSGPFHTEKLIEAKKAFEKELENIEFNETDIKVIKNMDGSIYQKEDNIKEILANHIIKPVRLDKAIKLMQNEGVEEYIEIGPGKVLTGFIKKDNKEATVYNINNVETLENYIDK